MPDKATQAVARERFFKFVDQVGQQIAKGTAARVRWQGAMQGFQQTMRVQAQIVDNVQADQPLLTELVNQSQGAQGALQAQQAANQLMALSAKQQMQIQQMMAAQYRAEAQEAARKAQAEEAARVATQTFLGSDDAYTGE